jgi:hypothetical protein
MEPLHTDGGRAGMAVFPEPQIHLTIDETDARGLVARITIDHPSHLNILNTSLN